MQLSLASDPAEPAPTYRVHHGDAVEWLRTLADGSVDLVITDPPYESLEKHRKIGTTTRLKNSKASSNKWFSIFPNSRFPELFREVYRVLRKNSHFYLFCDATTMFVAKPLAEEAGFRFWKPLIWDKVRIGMGYHYRARYECILFFEKGKRKLTDLGQADIITAPRIYRGYPAEKPVSVSEILVRQSSQPGELVIDPFMGSGSAGLAAVGLNRRFQGNDICEEAIEISEQRLRERIAERDRPTPETAPETASSESVEPAPKLKKARRRKTRAKTKAKAKPAAKSARAAKTSREKEAR